MISKIKLKKCLLDELNLSELEKTCFMKQTQSIFYGIAHDYHLMSSYEALEYLDFLITFRIFFDSEDYWERLIYLLLKKIRMGIYRQDFDPIASFAGICHVAGTIKNLRSLIPQIKEFSYSVDTLLVENVEKYLKKGETKTNREYELIYGLSGVLLYFLQCNNDNLAVVEKDIIRRLIDRSKKRNVLCHEVVGWHYYRARYDKQEVPFDVSNGCINYGVAHGLGGPLGALAKAYDKYPSKVILNVINDIITEYQKAYYYVNDIIYWPEIVPIESYLDSKFGKLHPRRMSWCYGSVGILRVLFIASKKIKRKDIEEFVVQEMKKIACMPIKKYLLELPIVCHGFVGDTAIMKGMYDDTQDKVFLKRSIKLIEETVKATNLLEFQNINSFNGNVCKYSYLVGYTGILQTLQTVLMNCSNKSEEKILIR